jgi:non-heme chloroperoxidase
VRWSAFCSAIKAGFPILSNPFDYKSTVKITEDEFHFCFGNHLTKAESKPLYERYAIPSVAHILWQASASVFREAGPGFVDFDRKERAPLLLTAGSIDHVVTESTIKKEYDAYLRKGKNPNAIVEFHVFQGKSHGIVNQAGWQDVADYALNFAESHTKAWALMRSEVLMQSGTTPAHCAAVLGKR